MGRKTYSFTKSEQELLKLQDEFKEHSPGQEPIEMVGKVRDPKEASTEYISAEQACVTTYGAIITHFTPSEAYKLQEKDDFLSLSNHFFRKPLPMLFPVKLMVMPLR